MPDKWEYPWYASWDLAFHCVVLAHIDPSAAKHQLLLLAREWYMHPNGQLPAYEWNFGDVNPPVQAWATLAVFQIDGGTDFDFLARAFQKLLINFTWWVNRKDACGDNVFEGGFLGLDNIGPFDRSQMLPDGDVLEQSDGTAWMAKFCLNMLEMALRLANHQPTYEDVAVKFFEHFALIAAAMSKLWDEQDGFFYDRLRKRDGSTFTVRARSMVGLLPIFAAVQLDASLWERLPMFRKRARWYIENKPGVAEFLHMPPTNERPRLISLVGKSRMKQILACMLDETEFLSPYGLRSLSRYHREHPLIVNACLTRFSTAKLFTPAFRKDHFIFPVAYGNLAFPGNSPNLTEPGGFSRGFALLRRHDQEPVVTTGMAEVRDAFQGSGWSASGFNSSRPDGPCERARWANSIAWREGSLFL